MDAPVLNGNAFNCKAPGCTGNMIINFPAEVKLIGCPQCGVFNCRNCNAVHTGMTCRQYLDKKGQNPPAVIQPIIQAQQVNRNPAPVNQLPIINEQRSAAIPVRRIQEPLVIPEQLIATPQRPIILPKAVAPKKVQPNILDGIHFNCKNGACPGYLNLRNIENIKLIACPVCGIFNCFPCQAIHSGMNCRQYRARMGLPDVGNAIPLIPKKEQNVVPPKALAARRTITVEELRAVDDVNLIVSQIEFECTVCSDIITPGAGVIIRSCGHECCKECLAGMIANNDRAVVPCITLGCSGTLQDREIRELVTAEIFDRYTTRSLLEAQKCIPGLFMCRTTDCSGMWCVDEADNLPNYRCGMCNKLNCHKCKAVHENMTCAMYQNNYANQNDPNILATLNAIKEKLISGVMMHCPGCQAVVERDEGCSWIQCSVCKTEICWATRGPRWGPKGQNDTSGGCKCEWKKGIKCHPECNYCH